MIEHHDGCFGCGQANPFGLQLENGRFFVKQDHQGERGLAHPGIVAAALHEAIGGGGKRLEVDYIAPVPIGVFVEIGVKGRSAEARVDGSLVARATVS